MRARPLSTARAGGLGSFPHLPLGRGICWAAGRCLQPRPGLRAVGLVGQPARPPQPWCCIAAPCPAWLLKYCFYYFFSLFRHCHLSCWYSTSPWQGLPSRAGAVAASRGRGAAPRLWAARGAGLRGDDAQGLRPLPAGVGPGPPRGVLMSVWLWLNCELSETAGDSGSAPGS